MIYHFSHFRLDKFLKIIFNIMVIGSNGDNIKKTTIVIYFCGGINYYLFGRQLNNMYQKTLKFYKLLLSNCVFKTVTIRV